MTEVDSGQKRDAPANSPEKPNNRRGKKKNKWRRQKEYLDDKNRPKKKQRVETGVRGNWEPIVKSNEQFENYYKALQLFPEEEWDSFMSHMRVDLPATFRVVNSRGDSIPLNNIMKEQYFSKLKGVLIEGEPCPIPENIPWYKGGLAWQIDMSRPMLRHSEELFSLHQFLVSEVERGSIARQEAVSMIPPLVLDVKPHHTVLDMCAAPGSKTLQLLEALHAEGPHPSGLVIANDGDNKRCYMLVTQTKRFNSLAFMITNEDATRFPNVKVFNNAGKLVSLKYDRILCDVPCTGDGTLRKNYAIWKKWCQAQAIGIHKLQRRILLRAMDMLAEGGRIVYSTCSLNPIENEATVLSALRDRPQFRLVPSEGFLPELKRRPGLTTWKVMHNSGTWYEKFEDVEDPKHKKSVAPTMFPTDAEKHNLERCMRVYPHDQNTGGFFICVIERKETMSQSTESSNQEGVENVTGDLKEEGSKSDTAFSDNLHKNTNVLVDKMTWKDYHGFREDPYIFQDPDAECFKTLKEWYQISEDFPFKNIFARSKNPESQKQRNLSIACSRLRDIIQQNENKIKIINCGLRLFSFNKEVFSKCPYRLLQEGAHFTAKYMGAKIFEVSLEDMIKVLGPDTGVPKHTLQPELFEKVKDLPTGIVVFYLPASGIIPTIYTCVYSTENGVKAYITEDEKNHFRLILGQEPLMTKRELKKLEAMENHRKKKIETAARIALENAQKENENDKDEADVGKTDEIEPDNENEIVEKDPSAGEMNSES